MDLLPTAEQQQIVDTANSLLQREFPLADARNTGDQSDRVRREHLAQFAELGWFGIGLSDTHGGVGYGVSEEMLLFVELGRNLMPPSLLGGVLGAQLAAQAANDSLLTDILEGHCKIAPAVPRGTSATEGRQVEGEWLAFDSHDADYFLIAQPGGSTLLETGAASDLEATPCIDPSLSAAIFSIAGSASSTFVESTQSALFHRGALLCSSLLLGIAEATLERSLAYARQREQYGKPIGSFQAIKHYCADMAIRCESVRSMLYYASISLEQGSASAQFDVHTLKALADDAAQHNANTAVQIHGGMGYTQEMDIHLFVKRAQVLATLFGTQRHHLRQLLAQDRPDH